MSFFGPKLTHHPHRTSENPSEQSKKKQVLRAKEILIKLLKRSKVYSFLFCILALASCDTGPSKEYKIGIDPSWYPLELMGKEKNVMGFTTELFQEIAKIEKIHLTQVKMSWDNLLTGLQKKQSDGILSSMQPYIFNQKQFDFSALMLQTGPVLIVPAVSPVNSLSMLSGKEVAVQDETGSLILEKYPEILIRKYDSIPKALNDVVSNTIDGAIVPTILAHAYCTDLYRGQLKIATPPLNNDGLRLVTLHGDATELMSAFNKGLKKMESNGIYAKLLEKWSLSTAVQ